MFELCASILAADFANLQRDMRAANAAGVDAFHIDVMDGHFVPAISFGTGMVRTMERLTTKPLDVHLMVEKPLAVNMKHAKRMAKLARQYGISCSPTMRRAGTAPITRLTEW